MTLLDLLNYYIQNFNLSFLQFKENVAVALAPLETAPNWSVALIFSILLSWFLLAIHHNDLFPWLEPSLLQDHNFIQDKLEFIARNMGINLDSALPRPIIYVLGSDEPLPLDDYWWWEYDQIWSVFEPPQTIFMREYWCRPLHLIHELVHYLQHAHYCLGLNEFTEKHDREACRITRKYLRTFYPVRYWTLITLYGFIGFCK